MLSKFAGETVKKVKDKCNTTGNMMENDARQYWNNFRVTIRYLIGSDVFVHAGNCIYCDHAYWKEFEDINEFYIDDIMNHLWLNHREGTITVLQRFINHVNKLGLHKLHQAIRFVCEKSE